MKILLLNDFAAPTGGSEINSLILREGLRKRGHDVRLFSSSASPLPMNSEADYTFFGSLSFFYLPFQVFNIFAFLKLRNVLAVFTPDVLRLKMFSKQLSPLIIPLLKDWPGVIHMDMCRTHPPFGSNALPNGVVCIVPPAIPCEHPHLNIKNRLLYSCLWFPLILQTTLWRHWAKSFSAVVAVSESLKKRLVSLGMRNVQVIPNGVPMHSERPPLSHPPTVAFAGRLVPEKGGDVLIRAFAKIVSVIPQARLLIAGEGPDRPRLEKLTEKLGVSTSVSFLGWLSQDKLEQVLGTSWVQAIPSIWEDPHPLTCLEAVMRGTAVVGSNCGGIPEIIQDGRTGVLVTPGDVDAWTKALQEILKDPVAAEKIGKAARQDALERFSEEVYVDQFEKLFKKMTAGELEK